MLKYSGLEMTIGRSEDTRIISKGSVRVRNYTSIAVIPTKPLDPREIVTTNEIVITNMLEISALIELSVEKGIATEEGLMGRIGKLRGKIRRR